MAAALQIPKVTRPLEVSENKAFSFVTKESKFNTLTQKRTNYIEKVGGMKPIWIIMSLIVVFAMIGLGIYEGFTAKSAIAGLIDPSGDGIVPDWVLTTIGSSLAIIGMMIGHSVFETMEEDEITGRREFGTMFWLSVAGAIVYIGSQYFIVKSAGNGDEDFKYLPYLVIGIALLELIVGGLLLAKALTYLLVFYLAIRIWFIHKGMNSTSRATNNSYRDYRALRDAYNAQNPNNTLVLEGNDNIRRAIAYYSGINLNNAANNNQTATPIIPVNNVQQAAPVVEPIQPLNNTGANNNQPAPQPTNQANKQNQNTTEEEVERFINDDDNLTF
ncbi:MAG: hypothetical protein KA952_09570 [Sediminibacterium sp.]|nr:hypothetical protein [Sediminibacterium sp.]